MNPRYGGSVNGRDELVMYETREKILESQGGRCAHCGAPLRFDTCELAHRIPQRKHLIRRYGKDVIHHEWNLAAVCRGSDRCNSAMSIGGRPVEMDDLASKIRGDLNDRH
jgi:5-methylcytosine-specific restriction endonuclease McrA